MFWYLSWLLNYGMLPGGFGLGRSPKLLYLTGQHIHTVGNQKTGAGVSLRGVRPALHTSPATLVAGLLLERVASLLLPLAPAVGRAGTLIRPLLGNCLTVCLWQALQFAAPTLDPFGEHDRNPASK